MGFINKIEQGLEKAVRGTFSKGGSEFEPVDLANRIRTDMDNKAYSISSGRTIAPNIFTINFAPEDFHRVQDWGAPLAEELCDVAIRHARAQGYSLRGSVRVTFTVEESVMPGDFQVDSNQEQVGQAGQQAANRNQSRPRPPAARTQAPLNSPHPNNPAGMPNRVGRPAPQPAAQQARPQHIYAAAPTQVSPQIQQRPRPKPQVILEINGQSYSIRSLPVVLGRGTNADITVEDTGVSRRHLEIMEQDGVYLAVDLGSTNGSYLNGQKLLGRRAINSGSVITMGRARIVFRLMVSRSEH